MAAVATTRITTKTAIGESSPVFTAFLRFAAGVRFCPGAVTFALEMVNGTDLYHRFQNSSMFFRHRSEAGK